MSEHSNYLIRPISEQDIPAIKEFTDRWIGQNYYSIQELEEVLELSQIEDKIASLAAFDGKEMVAIRLTFVPGKWIKKVRGTTPDKWNVPTDKVAYFKSLFVSEPHQASGLGKLLSNKSIEVIRQMGGQAILCHSWLESPNNSSWRYLTKMGFEQVTIHPNYWNPIDYQCTRCAPARCTCTAAEMIKYLN